MALQGSFSNLTARIPTNLWEMLNDYARRHTANNRSLALERILREWQAWDNDVKEEIKDARLILDGIRTDILRQQDDFQSRATHLVLPSVQ